MDRRNDAPANDGAPSSVKGKGKAAAGREEDSSGEQGRSGTGLLNSIARSAQSAVTPDAISSLLTANAAGKPVAGVSGVGRGASSETVQNLQRASAAATASGLERQQGPVPITSIRTAPTDQDHALNDDAFRQFAQSSHDQQGLADRFDQSVRIGEHPSSSQSPLATSPNAVVGAFGSARALDAPMHAHVRATEPPWPDADHLSGAWDEARSGVGEQLPQQYYRSSYHEAWARSIPAPMFPGAEGHFHQPSISQGGAAPAALDFMSALDAEEAADQLHSQQLQHQQRSQFPSVWRPPSPSAPASLTQEQYEMHRALAELQDGNEPERVEERIRPPDDDVEARTGVYAATAEDALRAIWNAPDEGQRASELVRDRPEIRSTDGAQVIRRIRQILQRGSYVDDVYGLPPALEATIKEAEQPETESNRDLRAKAIARLNALYSHLDNAGPTPSPGDVTRIVKDW